MAEDLGRGRGTGTITVSGQKGVTRRKFHHFGVSWGSLRNARWEGWKCCRERALEVRAGGAVGTTGRPSRGQAGNERV